MSDPTIKDMPSYVEQAVERPSVVVRPKPTAHRKPYIETTEPLMQHIEVPAEVLAKFGEAHS